MIEVRATDGGVVIEAGDASIVVTDAQARVLLKRLADALGYRVAPRRAEVYAEYDERGKAFRVLVREGASERAVTVPEEVVAAYVEAVRQRGPGLVAKRDLADDVLSQVIFLPGHTERLAPLFDKATGRLVWERLAEARKEYAVYYRAPVLVLEKAGIVRETRGKNIRVTEKALEADLEKVKRWLTCGRRRRCGH